MPLGIYKRTAEHNRKISESHMGAKNPMFGKKHDVGVLGSGSSGPESRLPAPRCHRQSPPCFG